MTNQVFGKDQYWFGLALISFFIIGCVTLHHTWLISDVNSYYNQALALLSGSNNLFFPDPVTGEKVSILDAPYSLGNAAWIALWQLLLGKKLVFVCSLFCTFFGIYLTKKSLDLSGFPLIAIFVLFFTLPLQFYTNTLMSGMPSFLWASLYLYMLVKLEDRWLKWFLLCALAVFSAWFRESNVLLLGGISMIHFMQIRKYFFAFMMGSVIGLLPRLVSHQFMFDDPFHFMLSEPFSLSAFVSQLDLYLILSLIFFPLGLLIAILYKGAYQLPFKISVLGFILFYTAYAYDATVYSGYIRGSLVNSRFLLPLAPFFTYMLASQMKKVTLPNWILPTTSLVAILFTVICQITIYREHNKHYVISQAIQQKYKDEVVIYDRSGLTNITRYINTLTSKFPSQVDISKVTDSNYMSRLLNKYDKSIVIVSKNEATDAKMERTQIISSYMKEASDTYQLNILDKMPVENGLSILVYELKFKQRIN